MKNYMIVNAKIVTPKEVINNGCVLIKDGIIDCIEECSKSYVRSNTTVFDAKGKWLLPGIVDLHNGAINKELEPRNNIFTPLKMAFFSLENRLLLHGITSTYHSMEFSEETSDAKQMDKTISNIKGINNFKRYGLLRHFINVRCDITGKKFCPKLMDMVDSKTLNLISLFDNSNRSNKIEIANNENGNDSTVVDFIDLLVDKAKKHHIPIASIYDDSFEKIAIMKSKGVTISEFPIDFNMAEAAVKENQYVVTGAANIVNEESADGDINTIDAVKKGIVNVLCSDYVPSSIIHAIFILHYKHGVKIHDAVNMATINPAKAAGIDESFGSIEHGKHADLILVGDRIPFVDQMFINGKRVLCMERNNLLNKQLWATGWA